MQSKLLWAGLVPAVLGACAGGSTREARNPEVWWPPPPAPAETTAAMPAPPAAATATPLVGEVPPGPLTDEQIAAVKNALDGARIDEAKLAEERAVNARVRDFATTLVAEHSRAKEEQAELMNRLDVAPVESRNSAAIEDECRRTLESLRNTDGIEFDRAFIDVEIDEQQRMLDAIDNELLPNAKNADLRAELEELRPELAANLNEALDVRRALASSPS